MRCSLSQDRLVSFCIKTASLLILGESENVHSDYLVRSKNYLYKILALRVLTQKNCFSHHKIEIEL